VLISNEILERDGKSRAHGQGGYTLVSLLVTGGEIMGLNTEVGRLKCPAATKILAILLSIVLILSMSQLQAIADEANSVTNTTKEDILSNNEDPDSSKTSGGGAFRAI